MKLTDRGAERCVNGAELDVHEDRNTHLAKHMVEQQPVQSPVAVKEGVHKHQTGRGASGRDNGIELAGGRG